MNLTVQDMKNIQSLVGSSITESNLKHVDVYISEKLGIFIPSTGFCEYAIKYNHTHPSYSFIIFFSENQNIIDLKTQVPENYYLISAMSPEIGPEEKITIEFLSKLTNMSESNFNRTFKREAEVNKLDFLLSKESKNLNLSHSPIYEKFRKYI